MESSAAVDACAFGTGFQQQQHDLSHHQPAPPQQQQEQFYMTSSPCSDVTDDQLMRQQMMMMMAYQYGGGGGGGGAHHDVYRLRHGEAPPGERAVNFTHPFSITNIMSARQQLAEFHDAKAAEFPAGEAPSNHDVTSCAYDQPRMLAPPPCALRESYASHVTDQKSTTPSLNGGGDGYDAQHFGIVSSTSTSERQRSPTQ